MLPTFRSASIVLAVTIATLAGSRQPLLAEQSSALRIVVVEGEDAVNIIQQKTAVAPVVEVRDRNDQPVAGAVVNFAIRSGRATFNGARTLSVTTDAAGRAAPAGFAPTGSGALQISASAVFQGQTAAAITIAQTNVLTAAQAAAVASASGAGGSGSAASASAGASAGSGGGGLSGTTLGILGGAAAGGLVAATKLGLIGGGTKYSGQFSGTLIMTFGVCTREERQTGTLEIELTEQETSISGTARVDGGIVIGAQSCGPPPAGGPVTGSRDSFGMDDASVGGAPANITFTGSQSNRFPPAGVQTGGIN